MNDIGFFCIIRSHEHNYEPITNYHEYTQKLLQALSHPVEQVRMGSIISLGNRKDPKTAVALAQCAQNFPTQITQNLQILLCLIHFPESSERDEALYLLSQHRSRLLAKSAIKVIYANDSSMCW